MSSQIQALKKRMKTTAYARFHSARRYDSLNNYSLFSLTISSFTLIFSTLLQKYSDNRIFDNQQLELIQLIASITIATLSIVVSLSSYSIKSEKMRTSAEEINSLISKAEFTADTASSEELNKKTKKIRNKYEALKIKSLNHKRFEFEYGKRDRKKEDENINHCISYKYLFNNYLSFMPYVAISLTSIIFLIYCVSKY